MNSYNIAVTGCVSVGFVGLIMLVTGLTSGKYLDIGLGVAMVVITIVLLELLNPNRLVDTSSKEEAKHE